MSGYVNTPGGVFLHVKGGEVKPYLYGEYVDDNDLADYQVATAQKFTDGQPRRADDLNTRSAEQREEIVQSVDLSAVPSDYAKLDEEEAQGVVRVFSSDPQEQAQILVFESTHQNRQGVMDAGTPDGKKAAEKLMAAVRGEYGENFDELPPPTGPAFQGSSEFEQSRGSKVQTPVPPIAPDPETGAPAPSNQDGIGANTGNQGIQDDPNQQPGEHDQPAGTAERNAVEISHEDGKGEIPEPASTPADDTHGDDNE